MTTLVEPDIEALARSWLSVDPNPGTRAETERLLEAGGPDLIRRFGHRLQFGTAGLRGRLGTGPSQMNRVIVRVVAAAIAEHVRHNADPHMVVGYDARHGSTDFAHDTARVLAGRGVRCTLLPEPMPTPLLAFAVRHFGADAGVMVTASHNPREDNGYKVYGRGGALITAPLDADIARTIDETPLLTEEELTPLSHPDIVIADEDLTDTYVEAIRAVLDPDGPRSARVAYTPLHGVGSATLCRAFAASGFAPPAVVGVQEAPDADFPTTPFPNPEESGVLDHLLALASEVDADVALANDPDADRLAVAVRNGETWHLLSGDDLGCILAEHLLSRPTADPRSALVINTVTSSRLLSKIARHHGADHAETLTGFKWIMDRRDRQPDARFVIGYEEALGYAVTDHVRDKDGISAALVVAELVSGLRDEGRTLLDFLDDLHRRHGVHRCGQRSIRFEAVDDGEPIMDAAMAALRARPPAELAGSAVRSIDDLSVGSTGLAPTNGLVLHLDDTRVVVRPSGTEPKMKVYVEAITTPTGDLDANRAHADERLRGVITAMVARAADTERADPLFSDLPQGAARAGDLRLIVCLVDLTTLDGDDTPGSVRALCAQARRPAAADPTVGPTAAVCVHPELVPLARELLASTPVRVAGVAGAAGQGAEEIDIVLNRSAFLSGNQEVAGRELTRARTAAGDAQLKVSIEVGELITLESIRAASRLAIDAGADFVKTDTGRRPAGASPEAVLAILDVIAEHASRTGHRIGVEIAGGVRTADDALGYLGIVRSILGDEWLCPELMRFEASSLLDDLLADLSTTESTLRR